MSTQLTKRDEQLLYLFAEKGLSHKEIAYQMNITVESSKTRASTLYRKLGLHLQDGQNGRLLTIWYWQRRLCDKDTKGETKCSG